MSIMTKGVSLIDCEASRDARLLLTSSGISTEAIRESARNLVHSAIRSSVTRILRLSDGWKPFIPTDNVSPTKRAEHNAESVVAEIWSNRYLKYAFGRNVKVRTVAAGGASSNDMKNAMSGADILLAPGGNSYQLAKGIIHNVSAIAGHVNTGEVAYIGESAGTIIAGQSLRPASLEPADIQPSVNTYGLDYTLGLVNADVVVHAPGRREAFTVPLLGKIAGHMLSGYETSPENLEDFRSRQVASQAHIIAIHDAAAAEFTNGQGRLVTSG